MIKKTTIACLVCSALSSFVCVSRAESLVVCPSDSDPIIPPSDTVTYDSITFKTYGQDFEKSLGKDKNIDVLNVNHSLTLNNDAGGGKTIFNISAKDVSIGGINYGDVYSPIQTTGSVLNVEADTFNGKTLTASGGTTINLGSSNNFIDRVVLSTVDDTSAIYASGEANVAIYGNDICIDAASSNSYDAPIYVTEDSQIELNAKDHLEITNQKSSVVIAQKGGGVISLKSDGTLNVNGKEDNKAIWLQQSDDHLGAISVQGNDVNLVGQVLVDANRFNTKNNVSLIAKNLLTINANTVDGSFERGGAIEVKNAHVNLNAASFEITNTNERASTAGIFLGSDGSKPSNFSGNFTGQAKIIAQTGVIVQTSSSSFSLSGDKQGSSNLTINGKLAGIHSQASQGKTMLNDMSVIVILDKETPIADKDKWNTPTRTEGIVGISAVAGATIDLNNITSANKTLNVKIDANVDSYKTSSISSSLDSTVNVNNFENVIMDVANTGRGSRKYGLRVNSGKILMNQGIGNVDIKVNEGTALYSSSASNYTAGLIDILANKVYLHGIGINGKGIDANDGGDVNLKVAQQLEINAKTALNVKTKDSEINIDAKSTYGSIINGAWKASAGKATVALGTSSLVKGKLQATSNGTIDLSFDKLGTLQGSTSLDPFGTGKGTGKVNLTMGNGSVWNVTDNSIASVLTFTDSTIDFSRWNTTVSTPNYNLVKSETFAGNNNTLRMQIDLANETEKNILADQFNITGKALGSHTADLKIDGKDLVPNKFHSENWLISQGADSDMSIFNKEGKNQYSGRGMVTTWGLAFVANGEEDKLNNAESLAELVGNTTGKGEGKWYLVRNDEEVIDPKPDPDQPGPDDPAEIQQITNLGISATQALSFTSELEDLRSRLGEVRYGAQDGVWVRAGYTKEHANGYNGRGFEQKTNDLHIGIDRLVATSEKASWLIGGALRYAKSKQEGFAAARGGDGELEQYSAKLYATYMHAKGSYADFVVQTGHYSQDLTGVANDLSSAFTSEYKTYGYGASVEVGHMFSLGEDVDDRQWFNHWFVEPQLQLSYFYVNGKDYSTSTGMSVSQSDTDFLTGRTGFVLGKKFNYGTANDLDRRYFQIGFKAGLKYEFMGDQTISFTGTEGITKQRKADDVNGARYYYGLSGDWQISQNFQGYAMVEREEGDHYTKDFDVSIGIKYQF